MRRWAGGGWVPEEAVGIAQTRVLLALVHVHAEDGRATVRAVADAADRSVSTTFGVLLDLRQLGLATWEFGKAGTLRPLVAHVPVV